MKKQPHFVGLFCARKDNIIMDEIIQVTPETTPVLPETTPEIKEPPVQESANPNNPELDSFLNPEESKKTEESEEHPEWFQKGTFKSIEEQAKAYTEAQKKMLNDASEKNQAIKKAQELEAQIQQIKTQSQQSEFQNIVSSINDIANKKVDKGFTEAIKTVVDDFSKGYITEAEKITYIEALKEQKENDKRSIQSGEFAKSYLKDQGYNPEPKKDQGQPPQDDFIQRYGEPIVIDDFVKQNQEFLGLPFKQEIFNQVKTLYGDRLGAKELQAIKGMMEAVEKGTEARIRNEYEINARQTNDKLRLGSAISDIPSSGNGQQTFTRAQISDPSFFAKYEAEIDKAMSEGRII